MPGNGHFANSNFHEFSESGTQIGIGALVLEIRAFKVDPSLSTLQFAKYQAPNGVKSVPTRDERKILGKKNITSHYNTMGHLEKSLGH